MIETVGCRHRGTEVAEKLQIGVFDLPKTRLRGKNGAEAERNDGCVAWIAVECLGNSQDGEEAMLDPSELFPEVPNLYEFPSVHAEMLFDKERVGKYREAIARVVKKGDVVADIGTGTGLLAFMCLQAGAAGFGERVMFHEGDSRRCELPEKVNVVVSELIGHIAFEEGMVESLLDAKERFLVPDGAVIPSRVELEVALVEEDEVYAECVDCWEPVEGIDYSIMRKEAIRSRYVTGLSDRNLLSESETFFVVDLAKSTVPTLRGKRSFSVYRAGKINGIALWFDAVLAPGVELSSGPLARNHWRQCFAPIEEPIAVRAGDVVSVEIQMKLRTQDDDRFEFDFSIEREI
jgi:hypothetical protein